MIRSPWVLRGLCLLFLVLPGIELARWVASPVQTRLEPRDPRPLPAPEGRDYADVGFSAGKGDSSGEGDSVVGLFLDPATGGFLADRFALRGAKSELVEKGVAVPVLRRGSPFAPARVAGPDGVYETLDGERSSALRLPDGKILRGDGIGVSDPAPASSGVYVTAMSNQFARVLHVSREGRRTWIGPPFRKGHAYQAVVLETCGLFFHTAVEYADPEHRDLGFAFRLYAYPLGGPRLVGEALRAFPLGASERMEILPFKVSGSADGARFAFTGSWTADRNLVWVQEAAPIRRETNQGARKGPPSDIGTRLVKMEFCSAVHSLEFHPSRAGELFVVGAPIDGVKNGIVRCTLENRKVRLYSFEWSRLAAVLASLGLAVVAGVASFRLPRNKRP